MMPFWKLRVAGKRRREMGRRRKAFGFESSRELSGRRKVGRGAVGKSIGAAILVCDFGAGASFGVAY
jgi:hypothetical protein